MGRLLTSRLALLGVIGLVAVVLLLRPPEPGAYAVCPLRLLTGGRLHCPGCGSLRCIHALVTGELAQAFAYNALTTLLYPLLIVYLLLRWLRLGDAPAAPLPVWLPWSLLWLILAFGVLRNVPLPPFEWLAPHRL